MKSLKTLLDDVEYEEIFGKNEINVSGITADSRKVENGSLFIAIKGLTVDGHDFIEQAMQNGAAAVIGENDPEKRWLEDTTYVRVKDSREVLGLVASSWNDHPSKKLKVIGVTGTKGKSTTVYILHHLLEGAGKKVGSVNSMNAKIGDKEYETGLHVTNPDPISLQDFLNKMVGENCEYAILEVTSHGLDQKRVIGVDFDTAVLTNIKHEHLDYHKTFDNYKAAKAKLFEGIKLAVLNKDDKGSFEFIKNMLDEQAKVISFSKDTDSDYKVVDIKTEDKMSFSIIEDDKRHDLETEMIGDFNALNFTAAITVARNEDVDWSRINKVTKHIPAPPGRLERIENDQGLNIYIDFAHTPDSLKKVLAFLREKHPKGKLIAVFGCASERDVLKRPMMGEISTKLADISIFTAEDPRHEDINKILDEVEEGVVSKVKKLTRNDEVNNEHYYLKIPERIEAIAAAITNYAKEGDTVVVCGKGHEQSMAYKGVEHPWSDKEAINSALDLDDKKVAVVLAAGKGTRLKGEDAKVLRKIAGKPMIAYSIENLIKAGFANINLVVGHKKDEVIRTTQGFVDYTTQREQLGTGHALKCSLKNIPAEAKDFIVLNGDDSAFFKPETINKIYNEHIDKKASVSFVSLMVDDPAGLGRVIKDEYGQLQEIVEEKNATETQKKVKEVNDGFYVLNRKFVEQNIDNIKKNKKSGEYYIVDLVKLALDKGKAVHVHTLENNGEWHGINTLEQLEEADRKMRDQIAAELEQS